MAARVSPRTTARAHAARQLSYGYFHGIGDTHASVRCPIDGHHGPHEVRVALNYGIRTPRQITNQLFSALTDHILEMHPEVVGGEQR
jgi:hypothetical protein